MLGKITGYAPLKAAANVKRRSGTSSVNSTESFADLLGAAGTDDAAAATPLEHVTGTTAVGGMLSMQEVTEEVTRRKILTKQAHTMLDVLEELRRRLLSGNIPATMLQDLNRQLSTQKQSVSDPHLISIIEDIELRVAVELAKLEKATDGNR